MILKDVFAKSSLASYGNAIHNAPRELIFNRSLLITALVYSMAGVPSSWDQGAASVISTLPSFQSQFDLTSGAAASQIRDVVAYVYLGQAGGAALSFLLNDRLGRVWSYRLYVLVYILGAIVATFTPGWAGLYASRILSGLAIGLLSVTVPVTLAEIAPRETRGLITAWYVVFMGMGLFTGVFCAYGVRRHLPNVPLQYQIVWFTPGLYMAVCIALSFFIQESPRWLFKRDRHDDGVKSLLALRGLPLDHPRIQEEIAAIRDDLARSRGGSARNSSETWSIIKETLTVKANLRRLQQTCVSFAFAQLSGANIVTSYFIPIMSIMGLGGDENGTIFLTGMYGLSKLLFLLMATFFFVDALGRRKSLFVGITCQMLTHICIGVYIKEHQEGRASAGAAKVATAALYLHAFGYSVGLLLLSYVFGGELWPNRIRSFGAALGQTFHWLFIYAMKFSVPSLLSSTNNWGAFIFFASWCSLALVYVYLMVPETSNMSVEQINHIFEGSWLNARRRAKEFGNPHIDDSDDSRESLENSDAIHVIAK